MDLPLSAWGYGLGPFRLGFPHLLSYSSPNLMRFRATGASMCIVKQAR